MKHDPLTYRYPRTLDEAFPNQIERGYAVFGYRQVGMAVTRWAVRFMALAFVFFFLRYLT